MTPDTRRLLTIEDVMKRLRVSRSMAYKLTESGALRSIRIGRSVRVRPADLDRFINVNEP
jgi:excisionase family DNA binding protein